MYIIIIIIVTVVEYHILELYHPIERFLQTDMRIVRLVEFHILELYQPLESFLQTDNYEDC